MGGPQAPQLNSAAIAYYFPRTATDERLTANVLTELTRAKVRLRTSPHLLEVYRAGPSGNYLLVAVVEKGSISDSSWGITYFFFDRTGLQRSIRAGGA